MDPSSAQHHHQEMSSQTLESMLACTKAQQDKKPRPPEQALKCPRCDSTNTKFCYYNNYSLTQPRYFCKSCRRYWTKGGTLRNVPVGGGCRKNKRSSSSSSSSKRGQDQAVVATNTTINPLSSLTNLAYEDSDISLAIARLQNQTNGHLGFDHGNLNNPHCGVLGNASAAAPAGFFDALRGGFLENSNGFHNLYYGPSNGINTGHVENGVFGINVSEEMSMMPYEDNIGGATTTATTVTTVKQEISSCSNARDGESRVIWGFPWQIGGGGEGNMVSSDLDSGRQSWNNGFGSSWHGLLNSPLM
ncbi:hypothetical protein ACH5RR_020920 [Cinchona calisaya]|uniref:Dof zinc finger protein n=1 Tax=Cinchona calisaya TaxID=153742 RepID=A0ABD2ZFT9_9GENT